MLHLILFFLQNSINDIGRIGPAYLGYLIPIILFIIAFGGVVILYRRFTKEEDVEEENIS